MCTCFNISFLVISKSWYIVYRRYLVDQVLCASYYHFAIGYKLGLNQYLP